MLIDSNDFFTVSGFSFNLKMSSSCVYSNKTESITPVLIFHLIKLYFNSLFLNASFKNVDNFCTYSDLEFTKFFFFEI